MSTHDICFHGEIRKICGYPVLSGAMDVGAKAFSIHFLIKACVVDTLSLELHQKGHGNPSENP